jgi:HTH-type transcriptional repressor of puuD
MFGAGSPNAKVKVIRKGEGLKFMKMEGFQFEFLIQKKNMELLLVHVDAGAETDTFAHKGEESHLILEGQLEVVVGHETYLLKEGDSIWHVSTIPHKWRNPTKNTCKVCTVAVPRTSISALTRPED